MAIQSFSGKDTEELFPITTEVLSGQNGRTWKDAMKNGMRPIHPGEILREEYLNPLGLSAHALSKALRVPPARVNEVVRETRGLRPTRHCVWPAFLEVMLSRG